MMEINSKHFKFVTAGFKAKSIHGKIFYFQHCRHGKPVFFDSNNKRVSFDESCSLMVHPEEYEKAVIEVIKGFVGEKIISITKDKKYGVMVWYNTEYQSGLSLIINADPIPWLEEYRIEGKL